MAAPSRSIPQAFDGLAPRGTISPVRGHHSSDADDDNRAVLPRVGVLLNSSPKRILNVSEPFENSIAALHLATTEWFSGCGRPIHADALDRPVDLAPAIIETSDTNWAANTTLDVEADFYAPTPVQGDRAHGGRMEPWSRSDACGLPAGTGSAASG